MRSHNKAICMDFHCLSLFIIIIIHSNISNHLQARPFVFVCYSSQIKTQRICFVYIWCCFIFRIGWLSLVCISVDAAFTTVYAVALNNKNLSIVVHVRYLNHTNPDTCIDSVSWMNMTFVKCVHESICDRFWSWVDDFTLNPFLLTLLSSSYTFLIPKNMHWRQTWAFST